MARYEVIAPDGSKYEVTAPDDATQEQVLSYAQNQFRPKPPTMGEVAVNAAVKAISSTIDLPTGIKNVVSFGLSKIPGMPESYTKPETGPAESFARYMGAIDPSREPQSAEQRYVDTAIQTGVATALSPAKGALGLAKNVVTGMLSGTAAQAVKEATGSELLKVITGLISPIVLGGFRAPQVTQLNPTEKTTLQDVRNVGYVVQPSKVAPSAVTNKLESIAGGASIRQALATKNQAITDKLGARALGLPEDLPVTPEAIETIRKQQLNPVYKEVSDLIPGGELRNLKVRTIEDRSMIPGPISGLSVKSNIQRGSLPGPATGLRVTERRGVFPENSTLDSGQGLMNVNELRDETGKLIGLKASSIQGPLEGLKTNVTSRGQDVPGQLEQMRVNVQEKRLPDVPGPLERLKVSVEETRGGNPMEELKDARNDAKNYFAHFARMADPESLRLAKQATAKAKSIEDAFEQAAQQAGKIDLLERFRAARAMYARTYVIENALNESNGHISAGVIGQLLKNKAPLTGELKIIGKFARSYPYIAGDASRILPSGVSGTDASMAAVLAGMGTMAVGDVSGAMMGGLPLLRAPARYKVTSDFYQSGLTEPPRVGPAIRAGLVGKTLLDYKEQTQ